jgi:hypothetical protein
MPLKGVGTSGAYAMKERDAPVAPPPSSSAAVSYRSQTASCSANVGTDGPPPAGAPRTYVLLPLADRLAALRWTR